MRVKVSCGKLNKTVPLGTHVMLEPNPDVPWPAGIKVSKQLIQMPLRDNDNITVKVENTTDEEVTLTARTVLGWLHAVDAVDWHPIPQIQEILENLGGNSWFTVLDQGKA